MLPRLLIAAGLVLAAFATAFPVVASATGAGANGEISVIVNGTGAVQMRFIDPLSGSDVREPATGVSCCLSQTRYSNDGSELIRDFTQPSGPQGSWQTYLRLHDSETFETVVDQVLPGMQLHESFEFVSGSERVLWIHRPDLGPNTPAPTQIVSSERSGGDMQVHHSRARLMPKDIVSSPTAPKAYFALLDYADEGYNGPEFGIWELDLVTNQVRLVHRPQSAGYNTPPFRLGDVSPDGRFLLYRRNAIDNGSVSYVYAAVDMVTGVEHVLHTTSLFPTASPRFAPDMTQFAYEVRHQPVWPHEASLRLKDLDIDIQPGPDDETGTADDIVSVSTYNDRHLANVGTQVASLAWRPTGALAFDIDKAPGGPGEYRFTLRPGVVDAADLVRWQVSDDTLYDWSYTHLPQPHEFTKPGTHTVTLTSRQTGEAERTATRTVDVPAPTLTADLEWDEDQEIEGRWPVGKTIDATLTVSVGTDGVGGLTEIEFLDDVLMEYTPDGAVDITVDQDVPEYLELDRGESYEIDLKIRTLKEGHAVFTSELAGVDAADRPVEGSMTERVRIGFDLGVEIDVLQHQVDDDPNTPWVAVPDEGIELDTDEEGETIPEDVLLATEIENLTDDAAKDLKVDMRSILTHPYVELGMDLKRYRIAGGAWTTIAPGSEQAVLDIPLPDPLAPDAKVRIDFEASARSENVLDSRVIVRGVSDTETPRPVSGFGEETVRIDQELLIRVSEIEFDAAQVRAGENWRAEIKVENLSQTKPITIRALTMRSGNIVGRTISDNLTNAPTDVPGFVAEIPADDYVVVVGAFTSLPDGSTRARLEMVVDGWIQDEEDPTEERELTDLEVLIKKRADKTPVNEFIKPIDTKNPAPSDWTYPELAWNFTDGFARGFGKWVEGNRETGRKIALHTSKLDVYAWEALVIVDKHLDPKVRAQSYEEVVKTVERLRNIDYAEAKAKVDAAVQAQLQPTLDAWVTSDWSTLSSTSGKMLGEAAPDKIIEAAIPPLLAARYMKYGGKTALLAAEAEQATGLLDRVQRLGRKGFKPGDRVSFDHATRLWGIDRLLDSQLLEYAQKKGIMIAVRDRSPGSKKRLLEGALTKIEKVKAKNVSDIDVQYLGFHPDHIDFAMVKQMPSRDAIELRLHRLNVDADTRAKVLARWELRDAEWREVAPELLAYGKAGEIPVPSRTFGLNPNSNSDGVEFDGVWDRRKFQMSEAGAGNVPGTTDGLPAFQPQLQGRTNTGDGFHPLTGDMDPIAILDESGDVLSLERRLEVWKELADLGFQHPESLTWDNPAGRAKYLNDFDLANGEGEALLAYMPDGKRQAVMFDSRKSRWDVDQRVLKQANMFFRGMSRLGTAKKVTEGLVKVLGGPPPRKPYFPPDGNNGAKMQFTAGTPLVRENEDGSYSTWLPNEGWKPYTPDPSQPIVMLPQTALIDLMEPGATRLPIVELKDLGLPSGVPQDWFRGGMKIVINPGGANQEIHEVLTLGSIIIKEPLRLQHAAGEIIAVMPGTAPAVEVPVVTPERTDPAPSPPTPEPPSIVPARGIAALDGRLQATVATVTCPANFGECRITAPRTTRHAIARRKLTSSVSSPTSIPAGRTAVVRVRVSAATARLLTRRSTRVSIGLVAVNSAGRTTRTVAATIAKAKGSVRPPRQLVRVAASGRVAVGTVLCPPAAGTCRVTVPRTVVVRVGRTRLTAVVSARVSMRAGTRQTVTLQFPRSVVRRLPTTGAPATVAMTILNEGGTARATFRARLRR